MTNITSLAQAFAQIEKCNFTCEAGPLENNVAWRIIKAAALTASAEREAKLVEALKIIGYAEYDAVKTGRKIAKKAALCRSYRKRKSAARRLL